MNDIYQNPNANLIDHSETEFNFSNLGIWRKIYLILNWLGTIGMLTFLLLGATQAKSADELGLGLIVFITIFALGFCFWIHIAVTKRKLNQMVVLVIIQIIPFFNPVGALIIGAIHSTSKKERMREQV